MKVKFLNSEKEIVKCRDQCNRKDLIKSFFAKSPAKEIEKTKNAPNKSIESKSPEMKTPLSIMNIPIEKKNILNPSKENINLIHFEFIKSICKAKYFRGKDFLLI